MYEFSIGWFFIGLLVIAVGVCLVKFYKQVADGIGRGLSDYDRFKLAGVITCIAGILMALNLHMMVIGFIVRLIFGGVK
jgi:hypothetical protein